MHITGINQVDLSIYGEAPLPLHPCIVMLQSLQSVYGFSRIRTFLCQSAGLFVEKARDFIVLFAFRMILVVELFHKRIMKWQLI